MAASPYVQSPFLVLRLSPCGDSSLVVAGLTPAAGQVHLMARGARRLGPKQFPVLDLFRLVQIRYRDTGRDLLGLNGAEPLADYGLLARSLPAFQTAAWLARFVLANVPAGVAHEALFEALCVGFGRLARLPSASPAAQAAGADAVAVGIGLTYLQEAGWLAEPAPGTPAADQCDCLLAMAAGGAVPRLQPANWSRLRDWVLRQARDAGCQLPDEH